MSLNKDIPMSFRRHGDTTPHTKGHALGLKKPAIAYTRGLDQPSNTSVVPVKFDPKPFIPPFLAADRKVLRFDCYFLEAVNESELENYRVRKCIIHYYVEDGSLQILEPKTENSGIPQGNFIKRHRIPKSEGFSDGKLDYISHLDLNIGKHVTCYGRTFRVVNMDKFTREFLSQLNIEIPEPEEFPFDAYTAKKLIHESEPNFGKKQNPMKQFMEASLGKFIRPPEHLSNFLENDRNVLRWYATWDDTSRLYGMRHQYTIHYFLCDHTVEIRESFERNSGCDPFPKLLNRTKLLRDALQHSTLTKTGDLEDIDGKYYKWDEFVIGNKIHVFGRELLILDCDQFTREWFKSHSIEIGERLVVDTHVAVVPRCPPPPHNGFGSEEDSLASCGNLCPKPPKTSFDVKNDKKILRFSASMNGVKPEDEGRKFTISVYLADNQIAVAEPPVRNSGILGGKFLEKGKHKKPTGEIYTYKDLYVGAKISLQSHLFVIDGVDEYSAKLMEADPERFPRANCQKLKNEIQSQLHQHYPRVIENLSKLRDKRVGIQEIKEFVLTCYADVCDHEILSLVRRMERDSNGDVDGNSLCDIFLGNNNKDYSFPSREVQMVMGKITMDWSRNNGVLIHAFRMTDAFFQGTVDRASFRQCFAKLKLSPMDIETLEEYFFQSDPTIPYSHVMDTLQQTHDQQME